MALDLLPVYSSDAGKKDPVASLCGHVPHLSTGDRAALRRLFLTRSEIAAGIVTGLLLRAGVPDAGSMSEATFGRWQLLAHVAAVLSGTAATLPHRPSVSIGRTLHALNYSDHRLIRLTSARGPALVNQVVHAARFLAASRRAPVDLWPLHNLSSPTHGTADAARLRIAQDFYAAQYASWKDAP